MTYFQKLSDRCNAFFCAQEGSTMPFIALGVFMMVGVAGIAVDMGRLQIVQSRLQNALDTTGLAVGSEVSTTNLSSETTKYFNANYPANFLGSTITAGPTSSINSTTNVISLSVSATVPMTFMQIFGKTNVALTATAQITRQASGMELVLVMDNTGSMNYAVNSSDSAVPKITAAQNAAKTLLNILYGTNNTVNNLWVGVVPFSQAVNIGTSTSWVSSNTYDWGASPSTWTGCVTARPSPYDASDDVPATSMFDAYYFASDGTIKTPTTVPSPAQTTNGYCWTSWSQWNPWKCTLDSGNNGSTHTLKYDYYSSGPLGAPMGPNVLCPVAVQPMVAEKQTVVDKINAMAAGGSTFINLGMAWGQRMLSPNWRGLWGGEMNTNSLPLKYNAPLMHKVVILMTDGMNEFDAGNYTAYGHLSDGQLGTTNSIYSGNAYNGSAEQVMDNRTLAICSALKANGVIIYTIGFGTDDTDNMNSSTSVNGTLLKGCASQPSYYFLAPTNAQLTAAFQQIGDSLSNLFVSH